MTSYKKLIALLLSALFSLLQPASAQTSLTVDNVYRISLRNSGPILDQEEVKGYYFFYLSDEIDRKTNEYTLQILDANLNKVKEIKFQDSKNVSLMESSFNGSTMAFMFYDNDQNKLEYRIYSMDGKNTISYSKELDKKSERFLTKIPMPGANDEAENKNIVDISKKGYLSVVPIREGKQYTYEVNFYSAEKEGTWTYHPDEPGRFSQAQFLNAKDSVAFILVHTRLQLMNMETTTTLLGLDLANGKKMFQIPMQEKEVNLFPMHISPAKQNGAALVVGAYFEGNMFKRKDKDWGLGIWEMNNKGELLSSKYISWGDKMFPFQKKDEKGKVDHIGYLYVHDVIQTEDGKTFAICEGYFAYTGMSANEPFSMRVTKMVVLQLDRQLNLEDMQVFEKTTNRVEAHPMLYTENPFLQAQTLVYYNSFDYSFTLADRSKTSFMIGYSDLVSRKDYWGKTFKTITYNEGKISSDEIKLKYASGSNRVFPARPGSLVVLEYFKKEKRLELRLEKMN